MMCRWCTRSFRRFGLVKVVLILFVTVLLFCFTLQLHQLPVSSAKVINKKTSVPDNEEMADVVEQVLPVILDNPARLIGNANGRSPKQVNENIKSRPASSGNQQAILNHTLAVETVTAARIDPLPSLSGPTSLEMLQEVMVKVNKAQTIYNQDKFPPLGEDGLVLIVQVHKREGYLKQLLESLRVAKGIEKVLLVISHDYYYDDMNKLILSIDFCPVSDSILV